jgi:hypothetical protein
MGHHHRSRPIPSVGPPAAQRRAFRWRCWPRSPIGLRSAFLPNTELNDSWGVRFFVGRKQCIPYNTLQGSHPIRPIQTVEGEAPP